MKRESSVETLRVLLMLVICILHAVSHGGHPTRWLIGALCASVNCFVFISGYYGIRFRPSKLLRLYVTGFVCAVVMVEATALVQNQPLDVATIFLQVLKCVQCQWFLHAYAVMMLLSSLLGPVSWRNLGPVVFMVFGWIFFCTIPGLRSIVPHTPGLTTYSGLALFGTYGVARLFRQYDWERWISLKVCVVGSLLSFFGVTVLKMDSYASPFCLVIGMFTFVYARRYLRIRMPPIIMPSVFAVFLLHNNDYGLMWLKALEDSVLRQGIPLPAAYVITGLCVFVGCLILDIPRRLIGYVCEPVSRRMCKSIDDMYERTLVKLENLTAT